MQGKWHSYLIMMRSCSPLFPFYLNYDIVFYIIEDITYSIIDHMRQATQEFVKILQATRKEKKLSQRELAALAGVPQSHISNIENGKVNIRISSLFEIARVLDLEPLLVPRRYVPAIKGMMDSKKHGDSFQPAFTLDDEDDDV